MKLTVFEIHKCDAGCGRTLVDPGYCPQCEDEIADLYKVCFAKGPRDREIVRPLPEWIYWLAAAYVVALLNYIAYACLAGGR